MVYMNSTWAINNPEQSETDLLSNLSISTISTLFYLKEYKFVYEANYWDWNIIDDTWWQKMMMILAWGQFAVQHSHFLLRDPKAGMTFPGNAWINNKLLTCHTWRIIPFLPRVLVGPIWISDGEDYCCCCLSAGCHLQSSSSLLLSSCPVSPSSPCPPSEPWPVPHSKILVQTNGHRRVLVGNLYL